MTNRQDERFGRIEGAPEGNRQGMAGLKPKLSRDGKTVKIRIPIKFQKRGGRKVIVAPDGTDGLAQYRQDKDRAMVKALARAYRWKRMLETGKVVSIKDLADAEKMNDSYLARILRLTLLAPDIVTAILDGRHPKGLSLLELLNGFPMEWPLQREKFGFAAGTS